MKPRELKEKDKLKSTVLKWRRKLSNGSLSKKESELNKNKELRLSAWREKRDLKSTDSNKNREKKKDKPESKLKD